MRLARNLVVAAQASASGGRITVQFSSMHSMLAGGPSREIDSAMRRYHQLPLCIAARLNACSLSRRKHGEVRATACGA
jgi:hypothetical protein